MNPTTMDSWFRKVVLAVVLFLPITSAMADDALQASAKPDEHSHLIGTARMTYLLWDVYDATLYAASDTWQQGQPFTLTLTYLRDLKGDAIAERSIEEMRKQGMADDEKLAHWRDRLCAVLPDVAKGTAITGVVDEQLSTTFFVDGAEIGRFEDPEFTRWFFDIWLGAKTSEPELRRQLLGESNTASSE